MKLTNIGLVEHAKKALSLKTKYMWAGTLNLITNAYITQKLDQCRASGVPASRSGYTDSRVRELRAVDGKGYYGVDCVCLVKSYLWGGIGSPKYTATNDVNANVMYDRAKVKGQINTMPEIPGLIVYSKTHPHVGIYIGNGETIESTLGARGDGVVKRKLDNFWEYWFECPFIEYVTAKTDTQKIQNETIINSVLLFPTKVRSKPSLESVMIGRIVSGKNVSYIKGSDTKDPKSGYIYVKLANTNEDKWIVKSAIKGV